MKKRSILYLFFIIIFLSLTLLLGPIIINYDKTGSNTYLLNKNYSYLSRSEILENIDKDFTLPKEILIILPNQEEIPLSLASVSAEINKNKIASTMLYRRLNQGITAYVGYFFKPKNFNLEISFDELKLTEQIDQLASFIEKPFVPTEISYKNNNISVSLGSNGLSLNKDSLIDQFNTILITGNFDQKINIETETIGSIPSEEEINQKNPHLK